MYILEHTFITLEYTFIYTLTTWKLELVPIPTSVTVFNVTRILTEQNATKLIHRWQYAIEKFDGDLFSRISKDNPPN